MTLIISFHLYCSDASKDAITLQSGLHIDNLTHTFEIRNNGPSNIKSLDVIISVPVSFINPWSLEREQLINFNSVSIKSIYNNQPLAVEWTQNNIILITDAIETTTTQQPDIAQDNFNGMQFDASKISLEYNFNNNDDTSIRRRRSIQSEPANKRYSPYMQSTLESQDFDGTTNALDDFSHDRLQRDVGGITNDAAALNNLPVNRTLIFNCQNPHEENCFQARITALNFKVGNVPILISLNFSIDLNQIGENWSELVAYIPKFTKIKSFHF